MTAPDPHDCEPIRELLSAQLDGALAAGEEEQLLTHLAGCSACQRYRERLRKTVTSVRQAGPLLPLPADALAGVEARLELAACEEVPSVEGCESFQELQSAQLDGELAEAETEQLLTHLGRCSVCQAYRRRLRKLKGGLPAAKPLVDVDEEAFAELDRRLVRASDESLQPAHTPEDAPARAGVVIPWAKLKQVARWVAAASVLFLGVILFRGNYRALRDAANRFVSTPTKPHEAKEPERPAPEDPQRVVKTTAPQPEGGALVRREHKTTAPFPEEKTSVTPRQPKVEQPGPRRPTPPKGDQPPSRRHQPTRVRQKPETKPVQIELAALRRLIKRIRSPQLPVTQRPNLIDSLGEARFDHPQAYGCLSGILRGEVDRFGNPNRCRRAAFGALGRLGTPRSVAALLRAPLRRLHHDHDSGQVLRALTRLRRDGAVAALAETLKTNRLDVERRFLVVQALASLQRPVAAPGLLALFQGKRQPGFLRREAAVALGRSGSDTARDPLRDGLLGRRNPPAVRQGSALGLGELVRRVPGEANLCVSYLEKGVNERKSALVSEAAIEGLGRTNSRLAVEPLIALLRPDERRVGVRRQAHRALCMLAGEEPAGVRTADQWNQWWGNQPANKKLGMVNRAVLGPKAYRDVLAQAGGVVFVIDISGSMSTKWELVLHELTESLDRIPATSRFQVIFFGDAPKAVFGNRQMALATGRAKQQILAIARRQKIVQVAQTVLKKTLQEALLHKDADAVYLISDGLLPASDLRSLRPTVRRWNRRRARPLRIHSIHVRDGGRRLKLRHDDPPGPAEREKLFDVDFMQRLAQENDGVYARN